LLAIPSIIKSAIKCEPPKLINGKAIPTTGKKPTLTPIFKIISAVNFIKNPKLKRRAKLLGATSAYSYSLFKMAKKAQKRKVIPTKPVSSAQAAKTKSVFASGKNCN